MRGAWRECSFIGDPERYVKEIYRDVKMPSKQVSLSMGAPLGNLEGIRLPILFYRKGQYIWVPSLDPENIRILRLGAIWNFGKGTGLSWADIRLWGTNGTSIRPRCIRTVWARTQCKSIYRPRTACKQILYADTAFCLPARMENRGQSLQIWKCSHTVGVHSYFL